MNIPRADSIGTKEIVLSNIPLDTEPIVVSLVVSFLVKRICNGSDFSSGIYDGAGLGTVVNDLINCAKDDSSCRAENAYNLYFDGFNVTNDNKWLLNEMSFCHKSHIEMDKHRWILLDYEKTLRYVRIETTSPKAIIDLDDLSLGYKTEE